ncbi:MAG: ribonuclease catalytic domain-containing protein [Anaerolineae bacterium]
MGHPRLRRDGLVLYKGKLARVQRLAKKIEIELEGGETLSVRTKDVTPLHPGPVESLQEVQPQVGEVQTAWELLAGRRTTLAELAELAYGAYTPSAAWAAWQHVEDGLLFQGTPGEIAARLPEEVAQEREDRAAKAAREQARAAALDRMRSGQIVAKDRRLLARVEEVALGKRSRSRLLRDLGRAESAQSAHALLLHTGYWDETADPYPLRLGLPTEPPALDLPPLPEEPRIDLTHLPAFAIDDEGNQEPDDALSLEGERLWVHIADVAALVPPDSDADLEARARGATLYLPEGPVPMLPWVAIQRLGLGLEPVSPALSFGLDVDAGEVTAVEVVPSWVRVTRLTYRAAEARLGEEPFRGLLRLALDHRGRREARGAISIDLPEVRVLADGDELRIEPVVASQSRELVTEAMLMAGEGVARLAEEEGLAMPFTTQDPPESEERPGDLAGMYALRRTMRPSQYSAVPGPHAGLGLARYIQATSPLRRYLDLVVHQQLRAYVRGERLLDEQPLVERVGATAAVMGSLRQAERLARKHWTLVYLQQHPEWRGQGVLVDMRGRLGTVLVAELDLDPRLHLRGEMELNSLVPLALRGVDLPALEAYFRVIEEN